METLISEDHYSYYDFEIWAYPDDDYPDTKYYYYKILDNDGLQTFWTGNNVIREAQEYFDTAQEARFAAIDHIDLLESGEG
jgi:hypothetical protein